jgi:hypothetical protein
MVIAGPPLVAKPAYHCLHCDMWVRASGQYVPKPYVFPPCPICGIALNIKPHHKDEEEKKDYHIFM